MTYPIKKLWEIAKVYAWSSAPQEDKYFIWWKYPFVRTWDLGKYWKTKNLIKVSDYLNELCLNEKRLTFAKKWTILFPKSWASILSNHRWILWMDAYFVSHLAWVDSWNEITNQYLYNYLLKIDMVNYCENPSYPSLKLSAIKEIKVPFPKLSIQKLIVKKLDLAFKNIDESIKITKRNLENIEELNKSVLEEVFQENFINLIEIEKTVYFKNWYAFKSKDFNSIKIWLQVIRIWNVLNLGKNPVYINESEKYNLFKLEKNDIIIWLTWTRQKKDYLFPWIIEENKYYLNQRVWRIRVKDSLNYKFLYFYLKTNLFRDKIFKFETWTVNQWNISWKDLINQKIPLPSLSKQKEIVSYLDETFGKNRILKEKYEEKLRDLEEMKQSFLREAFENEGFVE